MHAGMSAQTHASTYVYTDVCTCTYAAYTPPDMFGKKERDQRERETETERLRD